jgi:hypothetical protein
MRGLGRWSAFVVLGALLLAAAPAHAAPRVILVGLDSGDWDFIEPLMAAGHMPALAGIVSAGVKADYDCSLSFPGGLCFCPQVWTSVFTGWRSSVHKINNFTAPPSQRGVPAVWQVLRDHQPLQPTLVATAHTHTPAIPEATWIVTEFGALGVANDLYDLWPSLPPGNLGEPSTWAIPSALFTDVGLMPPSGPGPTAYFPFGQDRVAFEAVKRVLATHGTPRFAAVVLHSLDRTMHLACDDVLSSPDGTVDVPALLAMAEAWTGPVEGESAGDAASQHKEVDQALGELLALSDFDYVVIASDHGMVPDDSLGVPCHHLLPQAFAGIFALAGPGVRQGIELPTQDPLCTAPLLAYLMGLPVSSELPCVASGAFADALEDIFTPEHLAAKPPTYVAQWEFPEAAPRVPSLSRTGSAALVAALGLAAALLLSPALSRRIQ